MWNQFIVIVITLYLFNLSSSSFNVHAINVKTTTLRDINPSIVHLQCSNESTEVKPRNVTTTGCKEKLLIIGCGYSGTSLIAHTLSRQGLGIGHERQLSCGMSNWMATFEENVISDYDIVIAQVRHPFSVLNSAMGSNWTLTAHWNMKIKVKENIYKVDVSQVVKRHYQSFIEWEELSYVFKNLAWWLVYTERAITRASYWYQLEELVQPSCTNVLVRKIDNLMGQPFNPPRDEKRGFIRMKYNRHAYKRSSKNFRDWWDNLKLEATSNSTQYILRKVRNITHALGYDINKKPTVHDVKGDRERRKHNIAISSQRKKSSFLIKQSHSKVYGSHI